MGFITYKETKRIKKITKDEKRKDRDILFGGQLWQWKDKMEPKPASPQIQSHKGAPQVHVLWIIRNSSLLRSFTVFLFAVNMKYVFAVIQHQ